MIQLLDENDKAQIEQKIKTVSDETNSLKGDLAELKENAFDIYKSANVFDGEWLDGYMNLNGITGGTGYFHSNKIPTNGNTSFVFTTTNIHNNRVNNSLRFVTAFDENGNVLPSKGLENAGSDNSISDYGGTIISIPDNVSYIVITLYNATLYHDAMLSFDVAKTDYEEYVSTTLKEEIIPNVKQAFLTKYLKGKRVAVFGDSIMYGAGNQQADGTYKGIAEILADKYDVIPFRYAVSGSTMGVRTDSPSYTVDESHHIAKQIRMAIADNISPDVIIFNGGTNDIGGNITIGDISEVYSPPTSENFFADGFETVAYLLKMNYRNIPIIYMRAHNMSSRTYDGQIEYGELGIKIAEKWGFGVVDMYKSMNTQLASYKNEYLADYTHPNALGYNTFYIKCIEDWLYEHIA